MEKSEVLEKLNVIFKDTLENDDLCINYATTAKDVDEWDSLNHIQLVVDIEKSFNIRFKSTEIHSWNNVGEMIDSIMAKTQ
ncbi:acyl carrier protein [Mucilaginibacter lacusdianchii]|uniref:acyl carrier protein n=1 Tax=Mucilaginibacter lacusdianchii TaxID=2684211 RepID=UPI00131C15D8|nr:acyl carrier protein [Mucilaginibacter sp. JXJ CY 39]